MTVSFSRSPRLALVAVFLWSNLAAAFSAKICVTEANLLPLGASQVQADANGTPLADALKLTDGSLSPAPVFPVLANAEATIKFAHPTELSRLAIPRVGWEDWSIPEKVSVSVNGRALGDFTLSAPRLAPGGAAPVTVDVLELDAPTMVEEIKVTVDSAINHGPNRHGTLAIALAETPPLSIDFQKEGGVPVDSYGIELEVDSSRPVENPALAAVANEFRVDVELKAAAPSLTAGVNKLQITWDAFDRGMNLPSEVSPLNYFALRLSDPLKKADLKLISWKFLKDPARTLKPAWEKVRAISRVADQDGWREGVPTNGFGRFGWLQTSGLLVGALQSDGFEATAYDSAGKPRQAAWTFAFGEAHQKRWERTKVDWTTVQHSALYDYSNETKNELEAKAPELLKETRTPQLITGSILAPGILMDSRDRSATFTLVSHPAHSEKDASPWILYPAADGIKWQKIDAPLDGALLAEGWFAVVWPGTESLPLLVVPKKRPQKITVLGDSLKLEFSSSLERLAVGFPMGSDWRRQEAGKKQNPAKIAVSCRKLAAILRAYPIGSAQRFREDEARQEIEVEETINHLIWDNDWREASYAIAPFSPVLSFAQAQGYPARLENPAKENLVWPTKYGPYLYAEGCTAKYRLPLPPQHTTLYLRPAGENKLADSLAREIAGFRPDPEWLRRDALSSWWMWAPSSLAFPLLNAEQKQIFLANWKQTLKHYLGVHGWYLRKEPFSGAEYALSFGWVEPNTDTIGDANSGLGAVLYAMWAYARCSGDWEFAREKWPIIRSAFDYYLYEHDWCQMQTGAREHSGSSAIDMDGIGYEGALAYAQIAENLGMKDEAALGRLLVARLAVPTSMRWLALQWQAPNLDRAKWNSIGVGFSEFMGFDTLALDHGGPDLLNSEIALSLSWVGQYPELYDLHLWGLGAEFWKWFESDYVENRLPDWRKHHEGNRNNHPANIAAHLYFRARLGNSTESLLGELRKQDEWALNPVGDIARENAGFYALLLGQDFPLTLRSWGTAGVKKAEFDSAREVALLSFDGKVPFDLVLDARKPMRGISINGANTSFSQATGTVKVAVPAGKSDLTINFK